MCQDRWTISFSLRPSLRVSASLWWQSEDWAWTDKEKRNCKLAAARTFFYYSICCETTNIKFLILSHSLWCVGRPQYAVERMNSGHQLFLSSHYCVTAWTTNLRKRKKKDRNLLGGPWSHICERKKAGAASTATKNAYAGIPTQRLALKSYLLPFFCDGPIYE